MGVKKKNVRSFTHAWGYSRSCWSGVILPPPSRSACGARAWIRRMRLFILFAGSNHGRHGLIWEDRKRKKKKEGSSKIGVRTAVLLLRAGKVRGRSAAQKGEGKDDFHGCGACDCEGACLLVKVLLWSTGAMNNHKTCGWVEKLKIAQEFDHRNSN